MKRIEDILYPGFDTFGFYAVDGTFPFLLRVHELLPENGVFLDYGAGRGGQAEASKGIKAHLLDFRNRAGRVIGVDVDPAVMENRFVHEAHVLDQDGTIPLADNSVDVVMADWVCEHLEKPQETFRELFRVLKPGGWVAFRTPNKWHYSMIASRVIPDRHHAKVLASAQKGREERDVFRKYYRMNTPGASAQVLRSCGFSRIFFTSHEPEPVYLHFNTVAFLFGAIYQRLAAFAPAHAGRLVLMGFAQKPTDSG